MSEVSGPLAREAPLLFAVISQTTIWRRPLYHFDRANGRWRAVTNTRRPGPSPGPRGNNRFPYRLDFNGNSAFWAVERRRSWRYWWISRSAPNVRC